MSVLDGFNGTKEKQQRWGSVPKANMYPLTTIDTPPAPIVIGTVDFVQEQI